MHEPLDHLRLHCGSKLGAVASRRDVYYVLRGSLDFFAQFDAGTASPSVLLRVSDADLLRVSQAFAGVRKSDKMKWNTKGWTWADVPVDGSVPEAVIVELIGNSYQLLLDRLDEQKQLQLELLAKKLSGPQLLAELIERYGLETLCASVEALGRQALRLRTRAAAQSPVPAGASKIGGTPDLPPNTPWPVHSSGKPLAFLAQMNLSEAAKALPLAPLPQTGVLQVFSVYGWQVEDCTDPQLPDGPETGDWTRILYHPESNSLAPRAMPADLNSFPAAAVEFIPIISMPNHPQEPAVAALGLSDDQLQRVGSLCESFDEIESHRLGYPATHQLLGYAHYEQDLPEFDEEPPLRMLFQLASDDHPAMYWGDGGYLYFWSLPELIGKNDFSQITTDYQCG